MEIRVRNGQPSSDGARDTYYRVEVSVPHGTTHHPHTWSTNKTVTDFATLHYELSEIVPREDLPIHIGTPTTNHQSLENYLVKVEAQKHRWPPRAQAVVRHFLEVPRSHPTWSGTAFFVWCAALYHRWQCPHKSQTDQEMREFSRAK